MEKIKNKVFVVFLFFFLMLPVETFANTQNNSIFSQNDFGLSEIFIDKNQYWEVKGFHALLGSNLKNGYITSNTTEIVLTRKVASSDFIYDIEIFDSDFADLYASTTIWRYSINGKMNIIKNLENNKKYVILVSERDAWGNPVEKYVIGYFYGISSSEENNNNIPKINTITNKDKVVSGLATPNSTLYLTIGQDKYKSQVSQLGMFLIRLDTTYPAGTGVMAYTVDKNGIQSETALTVVKESNGTLGINPIYSSDSVITGKTVPNSLIEVNVDNNQRSRVYEGTSDSQGYFIVDMKGNTYVAGTQITVIVYALDGRVLTKKVIVYPPIPSVNTIHTNDTLITGVADPYAIIEVLINGLDKYKTNADKIGNFRLRVNTLKSGDKITLFQESNGIKSDIVNITVL
ncbi:hypothetical protein UAW_02485 [Enterococcus haemoperoxidus ATCC BAA-382]|uniref:Bacterial Ig domain-containing protein n=1 Tax=Enterococcus haemoperoxidus ATCC BAA-382 TaxID=1158608 RepID=R2SDF0_9ENTE|nr:Ig-like domain-containing protein [Enterococcus haemoperoxidus]EOH93535.1 hypothetical protein UAW_02485 [Enterococcus haemoperoxidus ATCC BAA-382]EOT63370.1 hypothetical protein I583_00170 [Enterococcus haemoperoxidus ATCC BAA-382]OJG51451.1 hypothetical protein RV06_GL001632 [Enterococcus haemoperoxidus]